MMNVVYLVLVFASSSGKMTSQSIPQANMKQCQVNQKTYSGEYMVDGAYCIVGVK